jgi:hypothetical protein
MKLRIFSYRYAQEILEHPNNADAWKEIEEIVEMDPGFGTRGLIGKAAVPLLDGADHDEANETED